MMGSYHGDTKVKSYHWQLLLDLPQCNGEDGNWIYLKVMVKVVVNPYSDGNFSPSYLHSLTYIAYLMVNLSLPKASIQGYLMIHQYFMNHNAGESRRHVACMATSQEQ